nr:hypothetical protein [Kribbella catacumbae]
MGAHLTIVFAALTITRFIEDEPADRSKKFVTAEDLLPTDLRGGLTPITCPQ